MLSCVDRDLRQHILATPPGKMLLRLYFAADILCPSQSLGRSIFVPLDRVFSADLCSCLHLAVLADRVPITLLLTYYTTSRSHRSQIEFVACVQLEVYLFSLRHHVDPDSKPITFLIQSQGRQPFSPKVINSWC